MLSDDNLRETEWTNEKKKREEGEDQRVGKDSTRPERSFAQGHGAPDRPWLSVSAEMSRRLLFGLLSHVWYARFSARYQFEANARERPKRIIRLVSPDPRNN